MSRDGRAPLPCYVMLLRRITAWMATAATVVTLTADAQPRGRSVLSCSLRDERAFATELQRALRMGDRGSGGGRGPLSSASVSEAATVSHLREGSRRARGHVRHGIHTALALRDRRESRTGRRGARPKALLLLARGVVSLADGRIIAEGSRGKYQITRMTSFGDTSTRLGRPRPVTFDAGRREVELAGEGR